jgi:hypothetical protein
MITTIPATIKTTTAATITIKTVPVTAVPVATAVTATVIQARRTTTTKRGNQQGNHREVLGTWVLLEE